MGHLRQVSALVVPNLWFVLYRNCTNKQQEKNTVIFLQEIKPLRVSNTQNQRCFKLKMTYSNKLSSIRALYQTPSNTAENCKRKSFEGLSNCTAQH